MARRLGFITTKDLSITVRGEVVAVQVPESMLEELMKGKQT